VNVAEVVGRVIAAHGVRHVFGVVGSGNFHVTNALVAAGARYVPAAHEGGAASMADGYARVSGELGVLSVHQGPGVTNALTGVTEAAKSRTPMIVLAPEATASRSNFFIDLPAVAAAAGAAFIRVRAEHAAADARAACRAAARGTVVLGLPLDVLAVDAAHVDAGQVDAAGVGTGEPPVDAAPGAAGPDVMALADALTAARRPVFIAGRGATRPAAGAREALIRLADRCGALLAVSAAAKGLFVGDPWYLDVSGGFASPLAAELIGRSDLVVAWGSTLNMWTTRHGRLISPGAIVAQVDADAAALGVNRPIQLGVTGTVTGVAEAVTGELARRDWCGTGWRSPALGERIAAEGRWRNVSYVEDQVPGKIDPRTLSVALDDLLPVDRTVVIDSGNFMGYPSMFLSVPDVHGFVFTQAFQSIGLGLASALGAAVARPDRLTVAALGDGGFLMSVAELTTAARLGLPLVIVVYNDAAYGAEVHHFGPDGYPLGTVTFPDADLAAVARGFGCLGVTVREVADLAPVREWLAGGRRQPLVVDAKVSATRGSWWLAEAFRGH
jgi:thiamine pyrophosphate-dependent acetolactate synthase large subunit-like protein